MSTNTSFVIFQRVNNEPEVENIKGLSTANNISYKIDMEKSDLGPMDNSFDTDPVYIIKIPKSDFEKADMILTEDSSRHINEIDESHYLYSFSTEELMEIIEKKDEWSRIDFLLAKQILSSRGIGLTEQRITDLNQKRNKDLSAPYQNNKGWIIAGYTFAILGGFLGVFIGWHLWTHKKTLPDGTQVPGYSVEDRSHGRNILILGGSCMIIYALYKVIYAYK